MAAAATNEIEFVKEGPSGGTSSNEQVTTEGPSDVKAGSGSVGTGIKGEKFQKVVMKPKTGGGSGQCKVYNSKLFTNERGDKIEEGAKIEDQVLTSAGIIDDSSTRKYSSITVYYIFKGDGGGGKTTGTRKYMALLVVFVPVGTSCVKKRYIKRTGRSGTDWESKSGVGAGEDIRTGTGSDSDMLPILLQQWEKLRPLIEFEKGHGVGGRGNENITTSEPDEIKLQEDSSSQGYTFKKVTMTANIDGGQWNVYSGKLITLGSVRKIQPETVFDDIVTKDFTTSSSNKYRSITVYYSTKDNSNYSALLVEFEKASTASGTSSDKIHIKRTNQDGTKWATTNASDIGIEGGKVTAKELNKIRTNAGVGNTSEIQINTDKGQGGPYAYGSFDIKVTEENPWDKLSKAFKKYTHTITYTGGGDYIWTNHNIKVYDKSSYIKFQFNRPSEKVEKVEIYFRINADINRDAPLILGFITTSYKYYYTWNHLTKRAKVKTGSIGPEGKITDSDLLTGLLEEIGPSVGRRNKYVINLNQKPSGTTNYKYPSSGHNKGKITLKKEPDFLGFEKYVHTINANVDGFYVTYDRNSRYFETGRGKGQWFIGTVTVYLEKTGSKKPVLFQLSIPSKKTREYKYYEFVTELKILKNVGEAKIITNLTDAAGSDLQSTLEAEREKLKEAITFVDEERENEHISTQGPDNVGEGKFKKVTMRPKTDDAKNGSSVGPWKVSNEKLFTLESGMKIKGEFLGDISRSKYGSITVFYNSDNKALLVEFDEGSNKTYFRRENEEGNSWDGESGINTGDTRELVEKLTEIEKIIKENSSSSKGDTSSKEDTSRTTSSNDAAIASSTVTTLLVSGGTGFAIYKYPRVFLSLIGR